MDFEQLCTNLTEKLIDGNFIAGTMSQPRLKSAELKRVRLKPVELRGAMYIQFEYQYERILKHENIALNNVQEKVTELLQHFRQLHAEFTNEKIHIQLNQFHN